MKRKWSVNVRLSGRQAFSRFFNNSEVIKLHSCTVFRIPNDLGYARLGITIKCRCTSVERTLLKRTIREGFQRNQDRFGASDLNVLIQANRVITLKYIEALRYSLTTELVKKIKES